MNSLGISDEEFGDLNTMKQEIQKLKDTSFDYLHLLLKATPRELETSGYRNCTNAEAMELAFERFVKKIQDLQKKHTKKYPDEGMRK
jgi:hypothetical protein